MTVDTSILWDQYPDNVKRRKHVGFYVSEQIYDILRNEIVHNPNLPFDGDMGHFIRHCVALGIDDVAAGFSRGSRSTWHAHKQAQKHLTNERYVIAATTFIDEQAANLRVWTDERAWDVILKDIADWEVIVDSYDMLKAKLAAIILMHPNMKKLYEKWSKDMPADDFEKVKMTWENWEEVAGV